MRFRIRDHGLFIGILLAFSLLLGSFSAVHADLWWDSSVYVGMGKYLYSGGESGLYEDARPVVWPLLLGLFWKLGLDAVLFGKVLLGLFSVGSVVLTYLLGLRLFSKRVALMGSFFLALNSTFFLFSTVLHSEIPSLFFLLLGVYLLVLGRHGFSGLALGVATMTRFFHLVVALGVGGYLIYLYSKKRVSLKELEWFGGGFSVPVILFLVYSFVRHGSFLYPFVLQAWMTRHTGWIFHQGFGSYFEGLWLANVLVVFSLWGLYACYKQKKYLVLVLFAVSFLPFLLTAHKEMRIIIQALPFLFLLAGAGIVSLVDRLKGRRVVLVLVLLVFLVQALPQLEGNRYAAGMGEFSAYLEEVTVDESVWITNPGFVAGSDHAAVLMYYPLYSSERIAELREDVSDADHVLISSCDVLPCPESDVDCEQNHAAFLLSLESSHRLVHDDVVDGCEQRIYTR
jgi:hypothetical protein